MDVTVLNESRFKELSDEAESSPLQSYQWYVAKKQQGKDQTLLAFGDRDNPTAIARCETRKIPLGGRALWIPRGPHILTRTSEHLIGNDTQKALRALSYDLVIATRPYASELDIAGENAVRGGYTRTIINSLEGSGEDLLARLPRKVRYDIRSAHRKNLKFSAESSPESWQNFAALCHERATHKGFAMPEPIDFLIRLREATNNGRPADRFARLFTVRNSGELDAGAIVVTCGTRSHLMWAAVSDSPDPAASKFLYWNILEHLRADGSRSFDWEGIDMEDNQSTGQFKLKFGGRVEISEPSYCIPLSPLGLLAAKLGRVLRRLPR